MVALSFALQQLQTGTGIVTSNTGWFLILGYVATLYSIRTIFKNRCGNIPWRATANSRKNQGEAG